MSRQSYKRTKLSRYFSVEGQTEKWYLERLQALINSCDERRKDAKFSIKVQKSPSAYVKSISNLDKVTVIHVLDVESNSTPDIDRFESILSEMNSTMKLGKIDKYILGYSNCSFELWMILHKQDCYGAVSNNGQYLNHIRQCFGEDIQHLHEFKEERKFNRILQSLSIGDVIDAIERSHQLQNAMQNDPRKFAGYEYYRENPSTSLGSIIEGILINCGIIKKKK